MRCEELLLQCGMIIRSKGKLLHLMRGVLHFPFQMPLAPRLVEDNGHVEHSQFDLRRFYVHLMFITKIRLIYQRDGIGLGLGLERVMAYNFMRTQFAERLDSDQIRQGLISIRNTQLELLNQLKYETEILKNYSPPSTNSQYSERASFEWRRDRNPGTLQSRPFPQDNNAKLTQSDLQSPLSHEKELRDEINYLKNENKLLISNLNKLKQGLQASKESNSQLQSYIASSFNIFYQAFHQLLEEASLSSIRESILSQICKIPQQKGKMKNYFEDILCLIGEKEKKKEESNQIKTQIQNEKDIASQLIDLKSQISILISHSNHSANNTNEQQIAKLKQVIQGKERQLEENEALITSIQHENSEIRNALEKEVSERKKITAEWEIKKKEASTWEQKEKKIIFYAKDMDNKAQKAEKLLKQKEQTEKILKENSNKLAQTINVLRQTNESLRQQVKSLEQSQQKKHSQLLQQKGELERQVKALRQEQAKIIQSKEIQLHSLRSHLAQIKRNQQALREMQRRTKGNDIVQQQLYWKKVNIMRTNSTIDHLWQVKEVEYENIHDLLARMKR